ncbi:MAG TPA: hypothetical protein VHJ20_13895 [Polyangia bacterium]|nr:hypothetical protein [Polyangia bacterium]
MLIKKLLSLTAAAVALTMTLARPSLAANFEPLNNTPPWFTNGGQPTDGFHGAANVYTTTNSNIGWGEPEDMPAGDVDYHIITCGGLATNSTVSKIMITFTHALGDIDMQVFTLAGQPIATSQGITNSEQVDLSALGQRRGGIIIRVYGFGGVANSGGYKIFQYCQ